MLCSVIELLGCWGRVVGCQRGGGGDLLFGCLASVAWLLLCCVVLCCVIELLSCRGRVGGCQRGGGGAFRAKKRQIAGSDTLLGCYSKCFWYLY